MAFNFNLLVYIFGIIAPWLVSLLAFKKYRTMQFKPLIYMIIGMFLVGISFLFDSIARFRPISDEAFVYIALQFAVLFFYPGTYLLLLSFFTSRNKIPWIRLMIYAFFYGMIIDLHLSADYFVIYSLERHMWFTNFIGFTRYTILDLATSLVMVDILILIIRRQYQGMISKRSKIAIILFWLGVLLPLATNLILTNVQEEIIEIRNFTFIAGLILYSIAFVIEPLCFTLSNVKVQDLIIARSDFGDVPVAQFSIAKRPIDDMKSQALSGVTSLLDEITKGNEEQRFLINHIQLGNREIIVERTNHYTGYLIGESVDQISRWGLRFIVSFYEKKYGNADGNSAISLLDEVEFRKTILEYFTFLSSKRNPKIIEKIN